MISTLGPQTILENLVGVGFPLFAQAASTSWLQTILKPDILPFVVAIVAIVCGCTVGAVAAVAKIVTVHRERMAKIQQGIDPDRPAQPDDV